MPESEVASPAPRFRFIEALLLAVTFAVAYTQSPLYYSNQNQYFLHGLAEGGHGHLQHDWLAQTADPTPVFSALIATAYQHLGEWSFQAAYFLILIGYFLSLRWLVNALPGIPDTRTFRLVWAAGITVAHAAIPRLASVELTGVDYPWFLQSGVAGQYVLGTGLQPSAFGVLLVTGVAAFANRRPVLAAFLTGLARVFHATYLLPAAMLVFGYVVVTIREDENAGPIAFKVMLASAISAFPIAAYALFRFGTGTDPATFEQAQRILAFTRIPHHCVVTRWFDVVAGLQVAWIVLGVASLWRTRLFLVLLLATVIGVGLTLLQYDLGHPTFALMFPWRISVVLVPVATAVILAKLAAQLPASNIASGVAFGVLAFLVAGGVWIMVEGIGYRTVDAEDELYTYVRENGTPDDVYLLPVRMPAVGKGRGSMSATFTPPPRPKPGSNLIPVDLQRFRLHSGAPIYVDFKSVPYKDVDVLEWLRRMKQTEKWYEGDWNATGRPQELRAEGITHIVTSIEDPISADYLEAVHQDSAYIVYQLK